MSSTRATNYLNKPTESWLAELEALASVRYFLVARPGPTVFVLKDENAVTSKVTLGNPHKCSCAAIGCIHLAFCITKVLKIPKDHPLSYQTSLTDGELDLVLSGALLPRQARAVRQPRNSSAALHSQQQRQQPPLSPQHTSGSSSSSPKGKGDSGHVQRQALLPDDENTCTICQDEMKSEHSLTWCRHGCGNNFHAMCMMTFAQHKISKHQDPSCPLCRELWDMNLLKLDCKVKKSAAGRHPCIPVHCTFCKSLCKRLFHRCVECSQKSFAASGKWVDFCADCFPQRLPEAHRTHHFLTSDASIEHANDVTWHPVKSPFAPASTQLSASLLALQRRELSVEDYDLLLQLDQPVEETVCTTLLEALPELSLETIRQRLERFSLCSCGQESHPAMMLLPCGHVTHRHCLRDELRGLAAQDLCTLADHRCAREGCGKLVFGGLQRRRKPPPAVTPEPAATELADRKAMLRAMGHTSPALLQPISGLSGSALLSLPQVTGAGIPYSAISTSRSATGTASSTSSASSGVARSLAASSHRRHSADTLDRAIAQTQSDRLEVGTLRSSTANVACPPQAEALPLIRTLRPAVPKKPPRGIGSLRSVRDPGQDARTMIAMSVEALCLGGDSSAPESYSELAVSSTAQQHQHQQSLPSRRLPPVLSSSDPPANPKARVGELLVTSISLGRSTSQGELQGSSVSERSRMRDVGSVRRPSLSKALSSQSRRPLEGDDGGGDSLNQLISIVHYC